MKNFFKAITIYLIVGVVMIGGVALASTITTIQGSDTIKDSRGTINTNFSNLNTDKFELSDWFSTTSAPQITTLLGLTNATSGQLTVSDLSWFDGLVTFAQGFISQASSTINTLHLTNPLDFSDYTNATVDTDYFGLNDDQIIASSTLKNKFSTGLLSGGLVTINADNTKFDVASGTGWVCDNHTDANNASCTYVSWDSSVANVVDDLTQLATRIGIDSGGSVVQGSSSLFTREELRDYIPLGSIIHLNATNIGSVTDTSDGFIFNEHLNWVDLNIALGTSINVSGNNISANGSNLKLDASAGSVYARSINRTNAKDPNVVSYNASTTLYFQESWQSGGFFAFGSLTTDLTPGKYDDGTGGTGTPDGVVASNRYSIRNVYLLGSSGQYFIQYGQATYSSIAEAIAGIQTETFTINPILSALDQRAWIIIKGDATDLSDKDQARICTADRFGERQIDCDIEDGVANMFSFANGIIINQPTASTTVLGGVINFNLGRDGGGTLTAQFNGQNFQVDTATATSVPLTAGTDSSPVHNHIYILRTSDDVLYLENSTTGFPTGEHAPVATVVSPSAVTTEAEGDYKFHLYDNSTGNGTGGYHEIADWIRNQHASWISDVALTTTGSGTGSVTLSNTSGIVRQYREHTFPAKADPALFYTVNDNSDPYATSTDLANLLLDSAGVSLTNKFYNLVLWGVVSQDSEDSKLFINLPSGSYNSLGQAQNDNSGFTNFAIPMEFRGTGFMIAKLVMRNQNDTTFTVEETDDLRGQLPGGIISGGGINQSTDFQDSLFTIFDDADPTKIMNFQISGVTAGNTRTVTAQDSDGTMCLLEATQSFSGVNTFTGDTLFVIATSTGKLSSYAFIETPYFIATSTTATSTFPQLDVTGLQVSGALDLDGTATSTGASGFDISAGCYAIGGTCLGDGAGSGTVTSIATTYPVLGGTITTTGTLSLAFGTTTANTWSLLQTLANSTTTHASITNLYISGDQITDFAGTGLTVTGGALNVDASQTQITGVGALGAGSITSGFGNIDIGSSNFDADGTFTANGTINFGGATSVEIVNGASPTVNATGEIAVDITSDQLIYFGASAKKVIVPFETTGFAYATTTWNATSTVYIAPAMENLTFNGVRCETDTGTVGVSLYDGTNRSNYIPTASTTPNFNTYSSNNTFTAGESMRVDIGTPASTPTKISCRFKFVYDAN